MIALIKQVAENHVNSATSQESLIEITKDQSTNDLVCDFVVVAIQDTENMPTHFDVAYATSRIIINNATAEQEQLAREGLQQ